MSDAVIGYCTWDACLTCAKYDSTGCTHDGAENVSLMGDSVLCDDYEEASDEAPE